MQGAGEAGFVTRADGWAGASALADRRLQGEAVLTRVHVHGRTPQKADQGQSGLGRQVDGE